MNLGQANYFLGATSGFLAGRNGFKGALDIFKSMQAESDLFRLNLNFAKEINLSSGICTGLKWFGRASAAFSIGYSYHQYKTKEITGAKFSLDGAMTAASFIPVIGPWIGGQYFIIDNTIGVENFNNMMINHANDRIDQINRGNVSMIFYPRFGQSVR